MKTIKTAKGDVKLHCLDVKIVDINKVQANTYNPNHVSPDKMALLEESILMNGFCFPVVTIYDKDVDKYIIVDGFHRYLIFKDWLKANEIPIIVLEHDMSKRMMATVQFNRARGIHQVELMADLVRALVEQGVEDNEIAEKLGMEIEEVYRLKQLTGIAELFKNATYSKAWIIEEDGDE